MAGQLEGRETQAGNRIKWIFRSSHSRSLVLMIVLKASQSLDGLLPCGATGEPMRGEGRLHPHMGCCRAVQPLESQPDSVSLLGRAAKEQRCPGKESSGGGGGGGDSPCNGQASTVNCGKEKLGKAFRSRLEDCPGISSWSPIPGMAPLSLPAFLLLFFFFFAHGPFWACEELLPRFSSNGPPGDDRLGSAERGSSASRYTFKLPFRPFSPLPTKHFREKSRRPLWPLLLYVY